ncbi:S8 family serine peptidase [Avibacterium sp. 20-129]|uniref:S8 family serine peptidase n=1 Tax=Avibacterium sp. 20-129 TaxID=2911525 RepID=UPI0022457400|nr:S8 family serine peptidase [Avibacterium sp. 20-129]MCW9699976.1 S8 family serine peptidase [Avibacterium sp. 20-129]
MNSPRLFSLSPLAMAITLALFPYLAQGNQNDAENRQDAVAKLAHLPEAQAQPHQWQDTDHNHINQDKLTTLRAMLVDTGVDLHTFEKDEIYPESIVAHGFSFYDSVSHHISTQLSPDMIDDGPEMHGTKMARVLLNTAGGGSIYPVQGLVRKRGEPVPHWRNRLLAMGVANERSIAQTGRAAPVVANIWVEGISQYAQPEYIEKIAHIANQGSLLLFANGNEPLDPAIPNEPYSSVSRMLAPNSGQLDERLKDSAIAITAITNGKQKYQPCGKAKNFCLAANADTPINYFDPILKQWIYADIPNGTSSATAYASGVALAIAQKYDWFKAKDIRNTLFTTANDKGDAGIDAVYGVGEINKQKALNGYGRFDAQNNNVLDVNGIAERYYFDNDIEGDSGFTKRGDKELVLNGNNRFQGKGVIEQGKLTINGTNTAQFEVKQGATLATGTSPNKISTGSLYNSGRLEVINPSPLYIEGDFTNTETGEINTAIGSSINVSGRAILNGVMRVSQIAQGYVPQAGRREVLLRANELVDDGIRLRLDSALIHIADTIAFDQNKKQIYVGLQRKNISEALDDLTHTITPPSPPISQTSDTAITNKEKTDTTVSAHSESAVINLADLPEAEKNYFPNWTDTDRYPTTSSSHKPAIAMLVDTGVDARTFKEGELYPESVAAKPNQTPSFEVQHYFQPDVNDHSFHGSKMGRILLNTAGTGQLYITQGVRAPNSSWRSILSASYAANQRLQQQTQKAAPVIGNIWKDFIEIQNYQEYINQVQNIKEQGSLQLFATGNESSEYHSEAGTQPGRTIIALIDNNTGDLLTSLKDTIIAVTGVKSNGQKVFRPCGKAKNFCITSNVDTQISYFNPDKGYREISRPGGTSSATAYASGVALAVKQKYDWFEAKDIRNTLFTTAIDKGTPGIDETWGVGVINKSQALMGYGRFDSQNDNRLTVNGIAERYYFNNDIEGDGGFTKLGEKELVFNGNNSFKGDGIIEQGKLTLNGSNQANFIVKQGGTLASGTLVKLSSKDQKAQPITSGSVNNFGIIESLNQTDWNINGNLINNATGVINKAIGSTINVSGIANLGGIMNVDQIAPYYVPQNGRREVLLRANGLVNNGIQLNLNPALIDVANTIVFDENKKEIYVGLQRKSVQQALEDQDTSNGHSPETPVIKDKVTPPTEETASTVETDNPTESASTEHSEETSTTEETTVPSTAETASTVETGNATEAASTGHSEETSTTEETTVPAMTETASTVETGNPTEFESNGHSEETSTTEETTVPATTETASTVKTDNATESASTEHSEETSTTEETTVPATTETASPVETDNATESASTGHSEETSTTKETTVPATTETASTVETDNATESISTEHSEETSTTEETIVPATTETASTVETGNATESESNGHSEETSTTEETAVPATTETASTVETDNATESESTEHSEETSIIEETTVPATTETASTVETDNTTESESTEHSEETSTTEETTVPATTETASTVETDNATESESTEHSEETSTTEETTVPATTETASTVETDNPTESASTEHSEETSTTEETTVPATTETASTVETDNPAESESNGHSEETSTTEETTVPPTTGTASTVETGNATESASTEHSEETSTTEETTVPPTTETASTVETDNPTESASTEHSEETSTTEETTVPPTTETASTVETDNATESESTEHSEETSITEETTVPATTETASTVETDNTTESASTGHSEETSTTEETTVPATTETASTVETDNATESESNGHSEEASSINKKNKAQRAYLGAMEDARLLDRVLEKLDQGYASQQLNTQQKQWANRLFNIDRTHFTEYLFSQGIQSLIHQQQSWVNHEAFQRLNWIASFSQKNHTALWISGENRSASPEVSHINTTDHFNSVAINGLLVEGKHRFSFSISEQRQKYEEHYKEVEKSFNERDVAFRLGYGYELIPNWTLLTSFNYGVGKLKYQQQFNTQNTHSQGNTQSYASTLGIHWSQPINAQWIWHNIANIDYTHKQLTHLMLNDDVKINRLVTEQTNIGIISELEYKLKNLTLFGRLALQKTLHNKNRGRVSYATTTVDIEQSYRLYPDWKPQFGIGMGYQYHNWRFSLSGDMAKDHYHRVNVSVGYSF